MCPLLISLTYPVSGVLFLLCTLLDFISCLKISVLSRSSPSSLTGVLSYMASVLLSCACSLDSLSTSTGTACINTFSSCPTAFLVCSHKYCSVNMVVPHMCFVLHVMNLPVLMNWLVYEHWLWLLSLGSTMTWCSHSSPSSHWTNTIDPTEKAGFFEFHFFIIFLMGL